VNVFGRYMTRGMSSNFTNVNVGSHFEDNEVAQQKNMPHVSTQGGT